MRSRRRRQVHFRFRGNWNRQGKKRGKAKLTVSGLYDGLSKHMDYWYLKADEMHWQHLFVATLQGVFNAASAALLRTACEIAKPF